MKKGTSICCICGKEYPSIESNNPFPIRPRTYEFGDNDKRCCKDCNDFYVLRGRAVLWQMDRDTEYKNCVQWFNDMPLDKLDEVLSLGTEDTAKRFRMRNVLG